MKKNTFKLLFILIGLLLFEILFTSNVNASEGSVSANNATVGGTITVTVNIPQDAVSYQGTITVTYSDGSSSSAQILGLGQNLNDLTSDYYWPGNASKNFEAKVAGNASITVSNLNICNSNSDIINSNKTLTTSINISGGSSEQSSASSSQASQTSSESNVVLNFSETNETMYTVQKVNIRQNYGTDSAIIQTLPVGTEVIRTGVSQGTKNGYSWSRVTYNGVTGYLITGSLTTDVPENVQEQTEEQVAETTEETANSNEEELKKLTEELGVIPEVGINIMPFIAFGSIVSVLAMVIEVKKNNK